MISVLNFWAKQYGDGCDGCWDEGNTSVSLRDYSHQHEDWYKDMQELQVNLEKNLHALTASTRDTEKAEEYQRIREEIQASFEEVLSNSLGPNNATREKYEHLNKSLMASFEKLTANANIESSDDEADWEIVDRDLIFALMGTENTRSENKTSSSQSGHTKDKAAVHSDAAKDNEENRTHSPNSTVVCVEEIVMQKEEKGRQDCVTDADNIKGDGEWKTQHSAATDWQDDDLCAEKTAVTLNLQTTSISAEDEVHIQQSSSSMNLHSQGKQKERRMGSLTVIRRSSQTGDSQTLSLCTSTPREEHDTKTRATSELSDEVFVPDEDVYPRLACISHTTQQHYEQTATQPIKGK